jgi:hypothetical protein
MAGGADWRRGGFPIQPFASRRASFSTRLRIQTLVGSASEAAAAWTSCFSASVNISITNWPRVRFCREGAVFGLALVARFVIGASSSRQQPL